MPTTVRTILLAAIFLGAPVFAADATLAGAWSGTWTDTREGVHGAGGDFSCVAVGVDNETFTATFTCNKNKVFKVELKGKLKNGEIVFDTTVHLGAFHGLYTFKGRVTNEVFTGEYSATDEKGVFTMKRVK